MIGPVVAAELVAGDVLVEHDWRLTVARAYQGEWTDHAGVHFGEIVVTRKLGPAYPLHFALTQLVQVERTSGPVTPW